MNTTKTARGRDRQIPAVAWKHVRIECGNVARRFRLDKDQRADLEGDVGLAVRLSMAKSYDPKKGRPYTFIKGVVHNQLGRWMRKETQRRNDHVAHVVQEVRTAEKARRTANVGARDSVDDTSYAPEDRWDLGIREPERQPGEERTADFSWELEALKIALVRTAVGRLAGDSRQICRLYLAHGRLGDVFSIMRARRRKGLGSARFYGEMWPRAQADFRVVWGELEKENGVVW